jgi:hypothetical protein
LNKAFQIPTFRPKLIRSGLEELRRTTDYKLEESVLQKGKAPFAQKNAILLVFLTYFTAKVMEKHLVSQFL